MCVLTSQEHKAIQRCQWDCHGPAFTDGLTVVFSLGSIHCPEVVSEQLVRADVNPQTSSSGHWAACYK